MPPTLGYWKRLWCWVTSGCLSNEEISKVFSDKELLTQLEAGVNIYKAGKSGSLSQLQAAQPDQTKLINVVQTLEHYMDIDCFQIWETIKHYLCDISYGTPANALKNVAFVDTRPSFLLPNIWKFYYAERLFLIKLLQHIIENKDNTKHKYNEKFSKIISNISLQKIKESLLSQFENLLAQIPPSRKIHNDFSSESVRQEWAESNLREQAAILQCLLIISDELKFSIDEFEKLFGLFIKNGFGKRQVYNDLLEERHREPCMRISYLEISLFLTIADGNKIDNISSWIESTKQLVEGEMMKLQVEEEHSVMLINWMMLTLQSDKHARLFESQYQHFGVTALKMRVFEFLQRMLNNVVFSDESRCALIARQRVFSLLNALCDKFDGDGSLAQQPGLLPLCAHLLATTQVADEFWELHGKEECVGVVSLWNTALELFPLDFSALSTLAAGLARAGRCSVCCLLAELKNLPVYTEVYNPSAVPVVSLVSEDAIIGRDYFPFGDHSYRIEAGSCATIVERKDATLIHFRTPLTYWAVFNHEIEKALDRKGRHNIKETLGRVHEGAKVLKGVLSMLASEGELPKGLLASCEGVFDILIRFMKTDAAPLPLLVACLEVCTALVPIFPKEIFMRLINTGLLPRVANPRLSASQYAGGASLDAAVLGACLVNLEQPRGNYDFLQAYFAMLAAFYEVSDDERVTSELILPGLVFTLREVLPNVSSWRYSGLQQRRAALRHCVSLLARALQDRRQTPASLLLRNTVLYSLFHTENAVELLNIVCAGNDLIERMMYDEPNWTDGAGAQYIGTIQRTVSVIMLALRQKNAIANEKDITPLEHLMFTQNKEKDSLRVVPKVTSYINHAFNKNFAILCCRLLKKFAESFQMSLFASLDMTAYKVRVMFLERLRDQYESTDLKIAILEFVATCVGKQPGLTEAFFKINHIRAKEEGKGQGEMEDGSEGILGYMADYLGTVKADCALLHSPVLACMMSIFHSLWRSNMQALVAELRRNSAFWPHLASPLYAPIQPALHTYSQIFNVLGIELFLKRDNIEPHLKEILEQFFDVNRKHLDTWIDYIFSFNGRDDEEFEDKVPCWLSLLTSWKDFTTVFCKCMPISLNIAHKAKMVAPCLTALLRELDDMKDGRLVVILSELYVIMLANWKDDCFDNRKANAKQIEQLLTNTAVVYDCLHPRAKRAILSIGTVALSSLDYEIKANSLLAQSVIRSVTNIISIELEKLFDDLNTETPSGTKTNGHEMNEDIPPVVLSLAMLEQCLELYDDMFSGLSQWFQASHFTNKLLSCLQSSLHNRRHYQTSLAALRCLTAYARGAFTKNLLMSDIDQFLWMRLLPPKFEGNQPCQWKPQEWWRIYGYSLDFIAMMVMKHGQFFVGETITFVGVHLEHLVEAILMPGHIVSMDSLNLCASTLNLIVQLVKYEARWRMENLNSLVAIMRSISVCVCECVTHMVRTRRADAAALAHHDPPAAAAAAAAAAAPATLHRTLEILHMCMVCLVWFSPSLLSLLADPSPELERWQPLLELQFASPAPRSPPHHQLHPQLTFGTLLAAVCLLTKGLNHSYHWEEGGVSRSPRRRRAGASPGGAGGAGGGASRGDSVTSLSSAASATAAAAAIDHRLLSTTLAATLTLLAAQALVVVRETSVPARDKQLVRRELGSELAVFHEFVRRRVVCAARPDLPRPHLARHKLGAHPLLPDPHEQTMVEEARLRRDPQQSLPPPPPAKRASHDSMREYVLRKHYLDKCAQSPDPPEPVSHSTPAAAAADKRRSKRVSWAETTHAGNEDERTEPETEPAYSNLTDVSINNDEDYFHFMSVVFLYICQNEL